MALPTRRPERRALTASATRLTRGDSAYSKRMSQPWQLRALFYYDVIGELHFSCQFIARQLSKVRYFPALIGNDGKIEEIKEGPPVEALKRIQDPGGGRSRLQYDYGRLAMVTGEGTLFGSRLDTEEERWQFLWKDEVKVRDDGVAVRLNAQNQETSDVGVAYRMWTPHPKHSDMPDSPMRAVLDIAEELMILTSSVRSTAVTRMTKGVFVIPSEISPSPIDAQGDEDPEQSIFLSDWMEHTEAQKENPGSAEASVPFLLEAGYEYLDRVQWIKTHDPATDYMEKDLRSEAIRRLALAMDMPPEALLGMTDANHWTAKQVMHDMWRSHGAVKGEQFADDLAEAYLRPSLRDEDYADWTRVVIGMDDSQVVISPDRTEDADKALDRIAIGFPGYRELKGIPEDFAPTDEEKEFLASLKMRAPVELENGELVMPQRGPQPSMNGNGDASEGPPEPTGGRAGSRQESRTASILGAAALALRQCRAKAGARLRSAHQHDCPECREKTDGIPQSLVASSLGEELVLAFKMDPMALVKGGTEEFRGFMLESGIEPTQVDALCQRIEVYAGQTLFDARQPELPPGFSAQVAQAEEVSYAVSA